MVARRITKFYFFFSAAQALALSLKIALSSSDTGALLTGRGTEPLDDFVAAGVATARGDSLTVGFSFETTGSTGLDSAPIATEASPGLLTSRIDDQTSFPG